MRLALSIKRASIFFGLTVLIIPLFLAPLLLLNPSKAYATTDTFNSSTSWTAPAGVTSVIVEAWGGGGGGVGGIFSSGGGGGGGSATATGDGGNGSNGQSNNGGSGGNGQGNGGSGGNNRFSGTNGSAPGGGGGGAGNNGSSGNGANGRITLTYTAVVISVTVNDGVVNYGVLATNTSQDTTANGINDTQVAVNNGTVTENFNIKGQDSANWNLSSTAGNEQYVHQSCTLGSGFLDDCDAMPTWITLTTSYQTLDTSIGAGLSQRFDLRLFTPTSTSATTQQSVNVTIQAVQS